MVDAEFFCKLMEKALSHGGDYADVYMEKRRQSALVVEDGRLEKITGGYEAGVGIRLIREGKSAYAFSNDLSRGALMEAAVLVGRAVKESAPSAVLDLTRREPETTLDVRTLPEDVPLQEKISLVRGADRAARSCDSRIRQVTAVYRDSVQQVTIAGSDGFIAEDERIYTSAVIQAVAAQGDVVQTGYEPVGGLIGFELFDEVDLESVSVNAAKNAVMMLTARLAPAGRMPVVIWSGAGGTMIHEAIGHGLEADLAQQGLSVFSGKIGAQVASGLVTVIDDSTLAGRRGSFRFDDEGTPSRRTVLVEDGILKTYLYDRQTARRDGLLSTGNGRRESYRHRPIPRMSNTFIAPGDTPPDAIVSSLDSGLLVARMGGGQVNTVTGDFVFDVREGYLIEHGGKGAPVRGATLTGNGPEVLKSIDMVGSDLGFSIGTCGKDAQGVPVSDALPTIRIPEIVVGGAHEGGG